MSCCPPSPCDCNQIAVPGPPGESAFALLIANLTVPVNTATPTVITCSNTDWMVPGMRIIVGDVAEGSATFQVVNILSTTQATVLWVDAPGDIVNPATLTVANGATVAPTGAPAVAVNGVNAFTILTANLTIPSDTITPVTMTVANSTWATVGQYIVVGNATDGTGSFRVTVVPDSTHITATWTNNVGDAASGVILSVANSSTVSPGGAPGGPSVRFMDIATHNTSGTGATTLGSFTLPAGSLANNGDSLEIEAQFTLPNNGNAKTIDLTFGATSLINVSGITQAAGIVIFKSRIARTAATTQLFYSESFLTSGGGANSTNTLSGNAAETLASPIVIKVTGTAATAGTISQLAFLIRKAAV